MGRMRSRAAMEQRVNNPDLTSPLGSGPSSGTVRRDIERGYLNTSAHEAGVYPGSRDTDYGRSDLRGSGSGLYPAGYDEGGPVSARVMSSPRIPNRFVTEGEEGSRLNPISDPQDLMGVDLLHTRVNGDWHRNGVVGGYTPAPPVDRYHPLWNVNGGPGSESALTSRLGGAGHARSGSPRRWWCRPHGGRPRLVGERSWPRCCRCSRARRGGRRRRNVIVARGIVLRSGLRDLQGTLWHRRPLWYRRS